MSEAISTADLKSVIMRTQATTFSSTTHRWLFALHYGQIDRPTVELLTSHCSVPGVGVLTSTTPVLSNDSIHSRGA